jgi:mannose-6-phosphate isomerase-like protein (cupin superfamily)
MVPWHTVRVPVDPDVMSPGGFAEIRHLIAHDTGDLTHVRVPAGKVSAPAWLDVAEFFYVWGGWGQLWRRRGDQERVVDLEPGTCVAVPAGTAFQYRALGGRTASATDLIILLAVVPHWTLESYHHADVEPEWPPSHRQGSREPLPQTADQDLGDVVRLAASPDDLAPDGSEIRLLPQSEAGGLAHCQVPPGGTTTAVRHRTVSETWFVLDGAGELWRSAPSDQGSHSAITSLAHGVAVDIPLGTTFQFRSTGRDPLQMLLLTTPPWPGPSEAIVADNYWT